MFEENFKCNLSENNVEEKEQSEKEKRENLFEEESRKEMTDIDRMNFLNNLKFWFIDLDLDLDNNDGDINEINKISCDQLVKDKNSGEIAIKELRYNDAKSYLPEGIFRRYKKENSDGIWCWKSGGKANEGGEELLLNGITREIPMDSLANGSWLIGVFDKRITDFQKNILKENIEKSVFEKQKRGEKIATAKGSFMNQVRREWHKQEKPLVVKNLSAEEFDEFPSGEENTSFF